MNKYIHLPNLIAANPVSGLHFPIWRYCAFLNFDYIFLCCAIPKLQTNVHIFTMNSIGFSVFKNDFLVFHT